MLEEQKKQSSYQSLILKYPEGFHTLLFIKGNLEDLFIN